MADAADQPPIDWRLVNGGTGWTLAPVLEWLIADGRFASGLGDLAGGLGAKLIACGAPIVRIRFASFTLHPMVRAWNGTWSVRDGVAQEDFIQSVLTSRDFVGSPVQVVYETRRPYRRRLDGPLGPEEHSVLHSIKASGVTDYFVMRLPGRHDLSGYVSYSTERPEGFAPEDIGKLETLTPFVAQVIDTINRSRIASNVLATYIGSRAGARVLEGHIQRGDSERIRAALWYSDLRDFTRLNEELTPEQMVATLNIHFGALGDAIMAHGGEVLQFIGDAVLAIFECAVDPGDTRRACQAALDAARDAFAATAARNAERQEAMLPPIRFGVGLHVGDVTFGNVGAEARLGFNVVGPAVNLTARLQSLTKEAGVPLLVSAAFAAAAGGDLRPMGTHALKGVREMQEVYGVAEAAAATPAADRA